MLPEPVKPGSVAEQQEIPVNDLDPENPRSVINLLTPGVRAQILSAIESMPHLFQYDEHELYRALGKLKAQPSAIDNRLRLAFWSEYNRAQENDDHMRGVSIYGGICTHQHFTERYLKRPEKVAWMLCPPTAYETMLEEALQFGVDQLRDILALPLTDERGKVNTSLAALKERIVARLDSRKFGSIVQRSLNVNMSEDKTTDKRLKEALLANNMEEIQKKLRALEKRDRLASPKNTVEVVVESYPTRTEENDT